MVCLCECVCVCVCVCFERERERERVRVCATNLERVLIVDQYTDTRFTQRIAARNNVEKVNKWVAAYVIEKKCV